MLKKSVKKYLQNIRGYDNTLHGNCNAGVTMSEEKGDCGNLSMWVMENGIETIMSTGFLEKEGYKI